MTKNPLINAIGALIYITFVSLIMNWGTRIIPKGPDTVMAPIAMMSLFTLSAAVMGYMFCLQPLQLYLDGKKKAAVALFIQTVGIFAGLTFLALVLLFSGAFR